MTQLFSDAIELAQSQWLETLWILTCLGLLCVILWFFWKANSPEEEDGTLIITCSWCNQVIGEKKDPGNPGTRISHGICHDCEQNYFPEDDEG